MALLIRGQQPHHHQTQWLHCPLHTAAPSTLLTPWCWRLLHTAASPTLSRPLMNSGGGPSQPCRLSFSADLRHALSGGITAVHKQL